MTYVDESNSTLSIVRQLSREGVKNDWKDAKADEATLRLGSPCPWETSTSFARTGILIQDILPTSAQHYDVVILELDTS